MTGKLNDKVNEIANGVQRQPEGLQGGAGLQGPVPESMTAAIAAYRAGNPPQIVQVFEVGTATMMAAKGAVKPVYQLMADAGEKFDPKAYLGAGGRVLHGHARARCSRCRSTARPRCFYINKDAFKKAGPRSRTSRPKTWPEVAAGRGKLKASGHAVRASPPAGRRGCSSRASAPGTTCRSRRWQNGFGGLDTRLEFNSPVQCEHIQNLADMAKKG